MEMKHVEETCGRTAKGDEEPTNPPVKEAEGISTAYPNLLRKKAMHLSRII